MDHLMWHKVSAKAKGKANAEFGFLGFCHFPGLVKKDTVSKLLKSGDRATYYPSSCHKASAAKADDLSCLVVYIELAFCEDQRLAERGST
jgi:hypothetical protein